jgi:hypothetical protein
MQRQAQQVQAQGRYGDDVLVHMNPAEVAGIAALTPGGLTRNPKTGQPEAFAFLLPMLASWGASSAAGAGLLGSGFMASTLGSALAGGIASGVSTAALTGDLKRGLVSGVTGAALGAATGGASQVVDPTDVATTATTAAPTITDVAANTVDAAGNVMGAGPGVGVYPLGQGPVSGAGMMSNIPPPATAIDAAKGFNAEMFPGVQKATTSMGQSLTDAAKPPGWSAAGGQNNINPPLKAGMSYTPPPPPTNPQSFGAAVGNQFRGENNLLSNIMKKETMIPMYMGLGTEAQMAADQEMEDFMGRRQAEKEEKKKKSRSMLSRIYGGYSDGGIVRMDGGGSTDTPEYGTDEWYQWLNQMGMGAYGNILGPGLGGYQASGDPRANDPISLQRRQHWYDPHLQDAPYQVPSDYVPGFNPEFPYFQQKGRTTETIPEYNKGAYGFGSNYYHPYASPVNRFMDFGQNNTPTWWPYQSKDNGYFNSVVPQSGGKGGKGGQQQQQPTGQNYASMLMQGKGGGQQQQQQQPEMAAGGPAPMLEQPMDQPPAMQQPMAQPPMMEQPMAPPMGPPPGGIANIPGGQPPGGQQGPTPQELEMVAMAIAGMAGEQGQQIIDMFIQKYGPDIFRKVREAVLQMAQPGAQTQGMIKGQGGGMDDKVMGTIGAQQPVAVSPGEYIVPADVVSGLGDGSSDAGAEELDRMSQDVRMARGGTAEQPPALDARRLMPR